ncbi:MAG TPA: DUF2934 domain-containing protein [Candidatus Polarisedimenticolaceae bacterium]|nr:DUF2934 domain-containing protein [Candidatus Polarisedimenticolaceae bacterium]
MDEANPKSAGKRAPRKSAAPKAKAPAPRPRRETPAEPPAPSLAPMATAPENGKSTAPHLSPDERHRLIAEAAYYRASQRGFHGGAEVEDWLAAEAEIDDKLLGNS